MKNKILALSILTLAFVFALNVYAVGQDSNAETGVQAQQQTQTVNQAEDSQIQAQNNKEVQTQTQSGNETEVQIQNQNQIQNQGEESQIQNSEQQQSTADSQNKSELTLPEQRRSQVANAVQKILQTAEEIRTDGENSGIGLQVRDIAQAQTQNQEKLENSLQKVEGRSNLVKFFIGPDYKEINSAKEILTENRLRVLELNELKNQLSNEGEQQNLTQQAQILEQVNLQVENSLDTSQKGFSLFGWLVKLFN